MPVQCQQCGIVNASGKFCAQCGSPLPQQPPASKSGWMIWAAAGGAGLLVLGLAAFFLLRGQPPARPAAANNNPPQSTPAAPQTGGAKVTLVRQGKLDARGTYMSAEGPYLANAVNNRATFYQFDAQGNATQVGRVEDEGAGALIDVAVGDMMNNGSPVMLVVYTQKIYVVTPIGAQTSIPNKGVIKILIGDYDGDGKKETVYLKERSFDVFLYEGEKGTALYSKQDAAAPFPAVVQSPLTAGTRSLLLGYTREGTSLYFVLYKWDGLGGPVAIGKYPVTETPEEPARWMASGPSAAGPLLLVSRGGKQPTVELLGLTKDAKQANSLGRIKADGIGDHSVLLSDFTNQGATQILGLDDAGTYFLYQVGTK